ncbi:beta-amyrin 28-oxidase-like [Chenopodium quinoa]|uniref:beta-amyrin 28-oxidase-like n=1 Tax=Chenopodium quinoa TaxID=63459 RepID=UPI000B786FAF|nr:beta-amyrin 28-oxidase-like [Chenopodium quinoa]
MDIKAQEHLKAHWLSFNEVKAQLISKEFVFSLACHVFIGCNSDAIRELAKPYYTLADWLLSVPVNLPGTPYNQALKASKVVQGKLLDLIKRRKAVLLSKAPNNHQDIKIDVQDLLSRVLITAMNHQDYNLISDEELVGHIIALLFAGFNTREPQFLIMRNTFVPHHEEHFCSS